MITTAVPFLFISPDQIWTMGDVGVLLHQTKSILNPAKLSFTQDNIGISVSIVSI